jgi:hypothetical protein
MGFKFQTEVKIPEFEWKTGYQKPGLLMGSCFTENIGNKMAALKYPVDLNPFGILYNPASVAHGLQFLLQEKKFTENDLIKHNGLWHSFFHHGRFSSVDLDQALNAINTRIKNSSEFLQKASFLFITFGTAWVYEYKVTGQTVSNCHKIPDKEFRRFRLTPGEITEEYRQILSELWNVNPELKVVFTVSPIRHWKDGAVENQRSKATLVLAIDQLIRGFGEGRCNYFPAYEIMMDELRDYRFYDEDMIHLSDSAINYIWEKFQSALIGKESQEISQKVQKIINLMNHRPINMFTIEHLHFLKQSLLRANQLHENYTYINLTYEINQLTENITEIANRIKNRKSNE